MTAAPQTTMPAAMICRNFQANQGIDKAVLRDICRLLGQPVVPQPHEPAELRQSTSYASSKDVYPPPQGLLVCESQDGMGSTYQTANISTDMDGSSLLAKVTKQIHDKQAGLYSQLLQPQQHNLFPSDVQHGERGTNTTRSNQTCWPSNIGTHGNNGSTPQQLLHSLSSHEVPRWSWHPHMGHSDIYGNATAQGFQQLPSETISPIGRPKQILRALSAYNFFFRDERDRIVSETEGQYETSSEKKQQLLAGHWYRDRTKKRRHRKTHGKIAFTELSKVISQRWKDLSDELKAFYREVAAEDLMRYHRELEDQKTLQDSLFEKRA